MRALPLDPNSSTGRLRAALTERQWKIYELRRDMGFSAAEIADRLFIKSYIVEAEITAIRKAQRSMQHGA